MTTSAETITESLNRRYAAKRFDPKKKIPTELWATLEETLLLAPSSYGLQPFKFFVVTNPEVRKKLSAVSWNQPQIEECSHLVVFAGKTTLDEAYVQKFIDRVISVRKVSADSIKGYKDGMIRDLVTGPRNKMITEWAARQAYIALGTLILSASLLGLDSCPMEGIEPAKYNEVLGLTALGYGALCVCAVGYRSPDDAYAKAAKVRFEKQELIIQI